MAQTVYMLGVKNKMEEADLVREDDDQLSMVKYMDQLMTVQEPQKKSKINLKQSVSRLHNEQTRRDQTMHIKRMQR